jgi:hypothetical protein
LEEFRIFLPHSPVEVRICVAYGRATTVERQLATNFKEELEQVLEASQAEEEEADNMSFVDLCEQIEALERRVIVEGMHIQHMRLGIDEEDGMGDHCDLSICRKILQQRRLHEQSQPLE